MKHLVLFTLITSEINFRSVAGYPAESTTPVPSFDISDTAQVLPDPDVALEIPEISLEQAEVRQLYHFISLFNSGFHLQEILNELGYEASNSTFGVQSRFEPGGSKRILTFQRANGLPETGILDDETRFVIGQPSCGVRKSDLTASGELRKWHKSTLTYSIADYPVGQPLSTIRALIQQAFHEWSRVTNLDFVEVGETDSADIELRFGGKNHWMRNGQCSFEGGNTLAHAFDPQFGDVHFNTQYYFDGGNSLRDFLETAVHEIGHSLGLGHILSSASIMHPIATKVFTKPQPIDVQLIQALYGVRNSYNSSSPRKFCSLTKIDAVFKDGSGKTYVFAGDYFYDLHASSNPEGQLISSKWPGLPGRIDAAFLFGNGKSYFFKGDKYFRFAGSQLERPAARSIAQGFPGLPNNVGAALVDGAGNIFVFKGSRFWSYKVGHNHANGPWNIRNGTVPAYVDAAVYSDGSVLSFKGKEYYWWKSSTGLSRGKKMCV